MESDVDIVAALKRCDEVTADATLLAPPALWLRVSASGVVGLDATEWVDAMGA